MRLGEREISRYVSRFERIPIEAIEDVKLNHWLLSGAKGIPPELYKPERLIEELAFFSFGLPIEKDTGPNSLKVQPPQTHRGFLWRFSTGFQDELGNVYGQIGVKGTGATRRSLDDELSYHRPMGLFGVRHAEQDMDISDVFAHHGGKTSRGLAIVTLSHDELRRWSEESGEHEKYKFQEELALVEKHGDRVCLYVRLLGADRYGEVNRLFQGQSKRFSHLSPYTRDASIRRAFSVVTTEIRLRGFREFQERYSIHPAVMEALGDAHISKTTGKIMEALNYLILHFFNFNRGVGEFISSAYYDGLLSFNVHDDNKDLGGNWMDWENSLPESGQQMTNLNESYSIHDSEEEKRFYHRIGQKARAAGLRTAEQRAKTLLNTKSNLW